MRDPYAVLGVSKSATKAEIKTAYRKLARTLHPDLNPGDSKAEDRFKEATGAYDLLSDDDKRRRFDTGEIDAEGNERRRTFTGGRPGGGFGGGAGAAGGKRGWSFDSVFGEDDIFSDIFSGASRGPGGRQHTAPRKGADARYRLQVTFEEAAAGTSRKVTLASGKTVAVKIPPATVDGHTLRLKGMGSPGQNGGPDGDALVEITIKPHAFFRREGNDIIAEIPIGLEEAVLGARITVPTVDGKVQVTVPEGSNSGSTLRLRGKGLPDETGKKGDQLVKLRIVLSDPADAKLKAFLQTWSPTGAGPRTKLGID